nr:hypothetical protein [Aquisphaera insulae]
MSKVSKTLERVLRGTGDAGIRFDDTCSLRLHLGFTERIRGDHHMFTRDGVAEILNLQPHGAQAKAHQIKQVRGVIVSHGLAGEPEAGPAAEGYAPGKTPRARIRRAIMGNDVRYEIILSWSQGDQAFIAEVPELPGCTEARENYRRYSACDERSIGHVRPPRPEERPDA